MSVPQEVEKALDERSKLGILGDSTDVMMKVAAAEAMKEAAKNPGNPMAGAGVGIGAGLGMGQMFAETFKATSKNEAAPVKKEQKTTCVACGAEVSSKSKFCPECGEKLNTKSFCPECGEEVSAGAKFCPSCGNKLK